MPYWTKEHTVSRLGRLRLQSPIGQRALQKNKPEWEKVSEKRWLCVQREPRRISNTSTVEEMTWNVEYKKALMGRFAFSMGQVVPIRNVDDKVHLCVCVCPLCLCCCHCCLMLYRFPEGMGRVLKYPSIATVSSYSSYMKVILHWHFHTATDQVWSTIVRRLTLYMMWHSTIEEYAAFIEACV